MSSDDDPWRAQVLQHILDARAENMLLQAVCANLLGEIALLHSHPDRKLDQMSTGLRGVVAGVAASFADEGKPSATRSLTIAVDRVCEMALAAMPQKASPVGQSATLRPPPKKTKGDAVYTAVSAAVKVVPFGGTAAEIIGQYISRPIDKRRGQWFQEVYEAITALQASGRIDIEKLADDESFASIVMSATISANKTHQFEKHRALRNCVLNAAMGVDPDDSVRHIFIDLVDRFTPIHLKLLRLFSEPLQNVNVAAQYSNASIGGLLNLIQTAYPELQKQDPIVRVVWADLIASGLVSDVQLGLTMSGTGLISKRTMPLGDRFVQFVLAEP